MSRACRDLSTETRQVEVRCALSEPPAHCPICFEGFTQGNEANSPQLGGDTCHHWACDRCWTRVMEQPTWKCFFCRKNLRDWLSEEYSYVPPADAIGLHDLRKFVTVALQTFSHDTALIQDNQQTEELASLGIRILKHLPET